MKKHGRMTVRAFLACVLLKSGHFVQGRGVERTPNKTGFMGKEAPIYRYCGAVS